MVVVALAVVGAVVSWQRAEAELRNDRLSALAVVGGAADAVDRFFVTRLALLESVGSLPSVTSGDQAQMLADFEALSSAQLGLDGGIGWIDADGLLQLEAGADPQRLPIDLSDRAYVQEVLATGRAVVSEGLRGRLSGDPLVIVAAPSRDATGAANGLVVASIRLEVIDELVPALRAPGTVTVTDRGGARVYTTPGAPAQLLTSPPERVQRTPVVVDEATLTVAADTDAAGWTIAYAPPEVPDRTGLFVIWGLLAVLAAVALTSGGWAVRAAVRAASEERRRGSDLLALERLALAVAGGTDRRTVGAAAARQIREALGAQLVLVSVAEPHLNVLVPVAGDLAAATRPGLEPVLPLDTPTLMTDAYRSDGPIELRSDEYVARYPHMVPTVPDQQLVFVVGRRFSGSAASGAVSVAFRAPYRYGDDERNLLEAMVAMLGDAFGRADATERERTTSLTLQRALLPADHLEGFETVQRATRYRPASDEARVGGDWYDLFPLDDERVAVVVGDVVGQGIPAAAVMGQLRSALRAAVFASGSPARALELLERFAADLPDAFASTALVAVLDATAGSLEVALAGHLPPLLVGPPSARLVEAAADPPLGAMPAGRRRTATRVDIPAGATIVFYTDGLVERRDEPLDVGIERLRAVAAAHAEAPVNRLADLLLEECAETSSRDDVALVALRPVGARPDSFSLAVPSQTAQLRRVREQLRRWLHAHEASPTCVQDATLAVSEAMANAIEHAYRGSADQEVVVEAWVSGPRQVTISVRDHGRWAPTAADAGHGRGIGIIRAVSQRAEIVHTATGTIVETTHELSAAPELARRP